MSPHNKVSLRQLQRTSASIDLTGQAGDLGVAVVGCGSWGKNLARCFAEMGCLGAVADHHPPVVETVVAQHGGRVLTFEQILADSSIHAVAIATQPSTHHHLARLALLAGKHVFVEKPLALEIRHAEDLTGLARRLDRRLMVGHILQYHPAFLKLRTLTATGAIGRILRVQADRMNLGAIRREEDVLWCLGPHDISIILALVGAEPCEVQGVGGYHLRKGIADTATLHLSFPAGEQAQVNLSWLHPVKEQRLTIVGSEAMIVLDDGAPWDRKLVLYPHAVDVAGDAPVAVRAEPLPIAVEEQEPLKLECKHFLDCIAQRREPRTSGAEGLRVMRVLARASAAMSAAQARWISPDRAGSVAEQVNL